MVSLSQMSLRPVWCDKSKIKRRADGAFEDVRMRRGYKCDMHSVFHSESLSVGPRRLAGHSPGAMVWDSSDQYFMLSGSVITD